MPEAEPAPWAPDISWFGGRWHLYYAISTFGSRALGHRGRTNTTLDPDAPGYRWVDHGPVVMFQDFNSRWNAIDPNVVVDSDGLPWLTWGSFHGGIVLQQLDRRTGKPAAGAPVTQLAERDPWFKGIEAPYLVRRGGYWYLFTSFGFCCRPDSNYSVRVGRSRHLQGPYVDDRGTPLLAGGGTLVLGGYGTVPAVQDIRR